LVVDGLLQSGQPGPPGVDERTPGCNYRNERKVRGPSRCHGDRIGPVATR